MDSEKLTRPIISSTGYPRIRIRFRSTRVIAVFHSCETVRGRWRRSATPSEARLWFAMSVGPVESIPEVPETGDDELARVERAVDSSGIDRESRPAALHMGNPGRCRDDTHEPNIRCARPREHLEPRSG